MSVGSLADGDNGFVLDDEDGAEGVGGGCFASGEDACVLEILLGESVGVVDSAEVAGGEVGLDEWAWGGCGLALVVCWPGHGRVYCGHGEC